MEEWDAQKMLDLYIYDYLKRKNMHTTADILAQEANIHPKSVVINPPEGFLSEWWSLFWDTYCSRISNNPQGGQASSSQPSLNDGSLPQNAPPAPPMPADLSHMLHNMCPTTPMTGLPDLLQAVNPSSMSMADMERFLPNSSPATLMPKTEEHLMAELLAQRAREQEHRRLPPRNLNANPNVFNVDQLASMLPMAGSSSRQKKKANRKQRQQHSATNNVHHASGLRRTIPPTPELTPHAPRLIQDEIGYSADTGRIISQDIPSEGCSLPGFGYADNFPASDDLTNFLVPSEGFEADISAYLASQTSEKLMMSASENSTRMSMPPPTWSSGGSKMKGVQIIDRNAGTEKSLDEDIAAFFSNDDASENMNVSFAQAHASAQKQKAQEDFPFKQVDRSQPSNNKLSCCDFSSHGKFLVAAGHEKKVFIWNVKQSTKTSIQAHTQIITDVRFKANSFVFATASFDRTVKIWDAANSKKLHHDLVGHADQVMSVDFHPKKTNLLCSCDSNDEIRMWHVKEAHCVRSFKGSNKMVRFQSRHGNFMAAATGNIINLIDVETGIIQHRLEGHEEEVRTLCWDVCGEYLVSTSQDSARIWSVSSRGKCIHHLPSTARDFTSATFHPAYSQVVAIGSYESIYIWNPTTGNQTWKFQGHEGIIPAMANAPETNMIASVSHDQCIKLWK